MVLSGPRTDLSDEHKIRLRSMDVCLSLKDRGKVLFLAIGGGGDVSMASVLALSYERCGGEAVIGSILWERYVVDPIPGPISINEVFNVVERGPGYAIVSRDSFAIRGNRVVVPQAVNVASVLGREVVVFDITQGTLGMATALKSFKTKYSVESIVGVDVGGDVIAEGFEEELWSPLADALSAAALAHIKNSYIAIASPAADGELPLDYIENRIRRIARLGGYIGGYMLSRLDLEKIEDILRKAVSEASAIPLKVVRSDACSVCIRNESRNVKLSLMNLAIIILDSTTVVRDSLARYVYETSSIEEARWILNKLTVVTEYDLEEEIFKELVTRESYVELDLIKTRSRLKKKLIELHAQ